MSKFIPGVMRDDGRQINAGEIIPAKVICCFDCYNHLPIWESCGESFTTRAAEKWAHDYGWRKKENGWYCPTCVEKVAKSTRNSEI